MSHKILLAWLLVLLFLVSPASSPSPVQARPSAVFTVNDTTDATDANPGDSICETAPGNGVCTLRAAIQETNALPGMDIIILPSGIYTLTIPGANEDNAATGDLDIRDDLTITGELSTTTIIDGNQLDRVFEILDPAKVPGVLYFVPVGKSPHGMDVDPTGKWIVAGGKLQPATTVLNFEKIQAAINSKTFEADFGGIPILKYETVVEGEVPVGLGAQGQQADRQVPGSVPVWDNDRE